MKNNDKWAILINEQYQCELYEVPYLTLNEMFWRILWWYVAYWQISGAHLSLKHAIYGLSLRVPVISSNTLSKTFNAKPFVFKQHKLIATSFHCFINHLGELNAKKCLAKYFVNYDMHALIWEKLYFLIGLSWREKLYYEVRYWKTIYVQSSHYQHM